VGHELPHGTLLKMEYRAREYTGVILNGTWVVKDGDGNESEAVSPSDAAAQVARTKNGAVPNLNGWRYWSVKRPNDDEWINLQVLRNEFAHGKIT